jgi:hypothetical protein
VDETLSKMESDGILKPYTDPDEPARHEEFGAMMALDYLRKKFGDRIAALTCSVIDQS